MKRILILLLSLTLCLGGLTACGSDNKNDAVNNGPGSGSVIDPDGSVIDPDGSLVDPDGSIGNPSAPNASQPNGGSAAGGDVSQLMAMMNQLMSTREGAELVERIGDQAKKAGLE